MSQLSVKSIRLILLLALFGAHGTRGPCAPDASIAPATRNAIVLQQVLASGGLFAIRERSWNGERGVQDAGKARIVGVLIAEKGQMRFLVTWPLGAGRRATYTGVVALDGDRRNVYSGFRYDGAQPEFVAYDLGRPIGDRTDADDGMSLMGDWLKLASIDQFSLESSGFTDLWQRIQ